MNNKSSRPVARPAYSPIEEASGGQHVRNRNKRKHGRVMVWYGQGPGLGLLGLCRLGLGASPCFLIIQEHLFRLRLGLGLGLVELMRTTLVGL